MEFKRDFYGASLTIKDDGEFTDDSGQVVHYEKFIKMQVGNNFIKLTALQLAGLIHCLRDSEVKTELQSRFDEEKKLIKQVEGF